MCYKCILKNLTCFYRKLTRKKLIPKKSVSVDKDTKVKGVPKNKSDEA